MKFKEYLDKIIQYDTKIEHRAKELMESKTEFYEEMISNEMSLVSDRIERLISYNSLLSGLVASVNDDANDFTITNAKQLIKKFSRALNRLENSRIQLEGVYKILAYSKGLPAVLDPFTSQEEAERKYLLEGMGKDLDECEQLWVEKGYDIADELSLFQMERGA